ncbi:tetratricopeptide repeat protein [Paraflavitalea speifideaquila]|uniref:tetratricopeptide repeat protein n=1 Tax=Paraflavitalea speifideaquila TaxID=3076558 RepID=UPI003CCD9086
MNLVFGVYFSPTAIIHGYPTNCFIRLTGLLLSSCQSTNEQLLYKANLLSQAGKFDQAIDIYTVVIKSNDQIQLAWYERGLAYQATRKYGQALADYDRVMALKTQDTRYGGEGSKMQVNFNEAFFQRAQVKFYVDSLESAYADFQTLLVSNYKNASCLLWQGAILVKKGEQDSACPFFIKAKTLAATDVEIQQSNEAVSVYCGQ